MKRYICIHGHFYQPPRENPWLESIERQDSAYPYHDWNERITAECYATNATSRMLDEKGRIRKISNNYSRISFNFGPTLLSWMQEKDPEVYELILRADVESRERFSGHGSAMAQVYNHMILPLANSRDKNTQVLWGLRDFESRFGRMPEGMWLAETAVDVESLDIMAALGLKFTVLAPRQAKSMRRIGEKQWHDVSGERIDPTRAYQCVLPSGRKIALFFYDGPISRAVAFEGLLNRGEFLADRLRGVFSDHRDWPQLVHIATDGESYGHHHRFGDMALAHAIKLIEQDPTIELTNYGQFLANHPPTHQVQIFENSSWSCVHGVERWRTDCGCNSGGHAGWNQQWRGPLRQALDWLRDHLAERYEQNVGQLLRDPWAARNDYISVVLDRSDENMEAFFRRHTRRQLTGAEKTRLLKALEMQRHCMLMYTSCGWFFDEISGIETVQIMQYAARAAQLARELFDHDYEKGFELILDAAKSNVPALGTGRQIYEKQVRPSVVDLQKVGSHYAVSSIFEDYAKQAQIHCYRARSLDHQVYDAGRSQLVVGCVELLSNITLEKESLSYCVLHLGDHNLHGGISLFTEMAEHRRQTKEIVSAFERADLPAVIGQIDRTYDGSTYSLKSLFRDLQRKILDEVLAATLIEAEEAYRRIYEQHAPLMHFLANLDMPMPKALQTAAEYDLNAHMRRCISHDDLNVDHIRSLLDEAEDGHITLDLTTLEFLLRQKIEKLAHELRRVPDDQVLLRRFAQAIELAHLFPFEVNLWKAQNAYYDLLNKVRPGLAVQAAKKTKGAEAATWLQEFDALGERLNVYVETAKEPVH